MSNNNNLENFINKGQFFRAMALAHPQKKQLFNYYNMDKEMFKNWRQEIVTRLSASRWSNGEPKSTYKLDDCILFDNRYNFRQMFVNAYMNPKIQQYTLSTEKIVCTIIALKEMNAIYEEVTKKYIDNVLD